MKRFEFDSINESQRQAVISTEGPVLMIAGPGTGKTFTIVKRIAYLVVEKHVKPEEIMVVTFTEKAGRELITRISDEFLRYDLDLNLNEMYIGTFHSVCLRLLSEYSEEDISQYRMMDAFEQNYLVCRSIRMFQSIKGYKNLMNATTVLKQANTICSYVNQLMEELVDIEAMENDSDPDMRFLAELVKRYLSLLHQHNVMDFASIQTKTYTMLSDHPEILSQLQNKIRYIMVDEYQDTNYIQERLVFMLAGEKKNICVVGDDDQGMYRFRGATIRNILEFPDKFKNGECKTIHLDINYRSEPDIISFYNRWMKNVDGLNLFNWNRYRYEKTIRPGKTSRLVGSSVYVCVGDSLEVEKAELLEMVKRLKNNGNITNYNQIAFLFRSVKSNEAIQIGQYFEENGVPVYSPRSEMFFQRTEVMMLIGCLILCFQNYVLSLKVDQFTIRISNELREHYKSCLKLVLSAQNKYPELMAYIEEVKRTILNLEDDSTLILLDVFYHLIAFEPFRSLLTSRLSDNVITTRAARNLSEISRLLAKFASLHEMHQITNINKNRLPEEFFNYFLKFYFENGMDEYEDASEYAPDGCVSFMTIHQSKGLEFPVVVVGSLGRMPSYKSDSLMYSAELRFFHRRPFEPSRDIKFFDFWRLYYTAFSRAQNLLVLAKEKNDCSYFTEYIHSLPDVQHFIERVSFDNVKSVNNKTIYSFTSHIAIFDDCPRQYCFFKEYGFAKSFQVHTSVGSLVHATLEEMNRYIIAGHEHLLNDEVIEEWFSIHYSKMQEHTGIELTPEQKENTLRQVLNYYHLRKDEIVYAWKAEDEIIIVLPDFILQGVIDLVELHGDIVEIIDYKTGAKPDIASDPDSIRHYREQLEVYAYLIEKKYGKKVSRMHLYYTNCLDGNPWITFEWTGKAIEKIISDIRAIIRQIENKSFDRCAENAVVCSFCEMRYFCGRAK
jgi:Superfamily I DNA and RNA helicases